jgi:RNA polymerase primary sigma factor
VHRLELLAENAQTLDAYLQEVSRFAPLSAGDEHALALRIAQHDEDALATLVGPSLGGVVRCARHFRHLGVPLIDLVRDGTLALLDAARRFDPSLHGRFAVYARWWIRQGVLHGVTHGGALPGVQDIELRAAQLTAALSAAVESALHASGWQDRALTTEELQELEAVWRPRMVWPMTTEEPEVDLDYVGPLMADEYEESLRAALVSDIASSLMELDPKERRVIELRLGLQDGEPRSLEQVTERLAVSSQRAERLSTQAVRKLRRQRSVRSSLN